ncbi:MAG: L,D-transpeptidase [Vicingus serpentipes]|nr:L,D-transpeptidase [Vicingus serpentipes]
MIPILKKSFVYYFAIILFLVACTSQKKVIKDTTQPVKEKNLPPEPKISSEGMINFLGEYLVLKFPEISFKKYMYVSIKHQHLYLIENDSTIRKYPISTAKKGIGNKQNSFKTPSGLHTVKRKIGDNVPLGGIFESRIYNGKTTPIITSKKHADKDYVTTRIMWLQGEENGLNRGRNIDSYNRFIYIHGTPEEGFIGQPASHGCIRMKNKDVVELYDLIEEGTPILILKY